MRGGMSKDEGRLVPGALLELPPAPPPAGWLVGEWWEGVAEWHCRLLAIPLSVSAQSPDQSQPVHSLRALPDTGSAGERVYTTD
ncbi:hypothetical protein Pmani_016781 [Petrolisthes manimaculis]|uniref:Uncharacterized protein n=1 Tax=Petrolisthes manimaculis TaxID=1843537 RepID=A0AAE1PQW5_9EUCA|nr:hypothetical protein Pmani_016781 [Petrolisthes manimaculis]